MRQSKWPKDEEVKYLITCSDGKYIVFIDKELDIDWATTDEGDKLITPEFNKIKNLIDTYECLTLASMNENIQLMYKRQLGEALVRAFEADYINADEMLSYAKKYLDDRCQEQARFWIISACFIMLLLLFILLGCISPFEIFVDIKPIAIPAFGGAVGTFLSLLMRVNRIDTNYMSSKELHIFEGICKMMGGIISAIMITFLIRSKLILPMFEETNLMMFICGFIAGYSERFFPSIINKIKKNIINDN